MAQAKTETPQPSASAEPQKVETYQTTPNPPEAYSGEALVVAAYALVWIAVFVFVAVAWRRTRGLEGRLDRLEGALDKARPAAPVPATKRSAAED